MSDRTFGWKKAGTSTFLNPSLVSPHTPTLANPTRGFGLPTNNVIQTAAEESINQQQAQSADEQSLLSEAIQQRSFSHDISRISLHRPQAKLTVGEPGDKYEQEADWMANQVMRMVVPEKLNAPSVQPVQDFLQRKCAACEQEEDKVQTKPSIESATDGGLQAEDNIESRLNSSKGGGSALADEVRSFMEPRFGADFSHVRVHTGNESVQMNQDLNAQAFTHKQDIYFGTGKAPAKDALTAHELTHVVQQTGVVQTNQAPKKPNVQLKCSACDEEETVQRSVKISSVSEMGVQRSWFDDDDEEEKKEPENSSGGGVLDWAKEKASGAVDTVSQAGGDAYDWAKEKGSAAVDTVTQAGRDAYDWAKEKGSAAVDTVTQAGSDAYDWAKEKASGAVDSVTQAGSDAYDWAKEKGSAAVDLATDVGGQALDLISNPSNIQVDWNSGPGMILKAWASHLDPEIAQDIRGKNPADLYNLVDVPQQVQQAAEELAKQARTNTAQSVTPMDIAPDVTQVNMQPALTPLPGPGGTPGPGSGVYPVGTGAGAGAGTGTGAATGAGAGAVGIGFLAILGLIILAVLTWSSTTIVKDKDENKMLEEDRKRDEDWKRDETEPVTDSASGKPRTIPVMEEGLSSSDQEMWKKCYELHEKYKDLQDSNAVLSSQIKSLQDDYNNNRLTPEKKLELCALLLKLIPEVERLLNMRRSYIDDGCDKIDWFKRGTTESYRRMRHIGELENVNRQLDKLKELRGKISC